MSKQNNIYLPGLNGIRAIAACGVMFSHINLALNTFGISHFSLFGFNELHQPNGWNFGEQGVTIFFVLSGFLITYLLLFEYKKIGAIDKKKFYIRRILRIWPLYYVYLVISILVFYFFTSIIPDNNILGLYVFLLANVPFLLIKTLPLCDHLWSIAVEEQFYLFWPHLFKYIHKSQKTLMVIIGFSIITRILLWIFYPFQFFTILFTVNRFDCMLFGALIAINVFNKTKIATILNHKFSQVFAWIIILIHILNFEIVNSIISLEFITLATGIIIIGQINIKNRLINLENIVCNFLGKYSFGIYIYHPLVIYILSKTALFDKIQDEKLKALLVFFLTIVCTIAVAVSSYELFEQKFINLKHKFSVIKSTNKPQ